MSHVPRAKPYCIAIAGGSGSGKSWLTNHLAGRLPATVIALDSYYRDLSALPLAERARQNFDAPEALDWNLLVPHLEALAQGRAIEKPLYDFSVHARTGLSECVEPSGFLIVEGLFALYSDRVRALCGTKVFVEVAGPVCLSRRIARDVEERGRTPESVIAQYNETVQPMYEKYILPTRAFADLVLHGEKPVEALAGAVLARVGVAAAR
jgi:uridine kinase